MATIKPTVGPPSQVVGDVMWTVTLPSIQHDHGFTVWLAGAGVKRGMIHGRTDELGFHAVEHPHYVTDLHATVLHQLGLDHKRLTFRFQGRDFRLTDVHGKVIQDALS